MNAYKHMYLVIKNRTFLFSNYSVSLYQRQCFPLAKLLSALHRRGSMCIPANALTQVNLALATGPAGLHI